MEIDEKIMLLFSDKLNEFMIKKNINVETISYETGYTEEFINKILKYKDIKDKEFSIPLDVIYSLCERYNIEKSEILGKYKKIYKTQFIKHYGCFSDGSYGKIVEDVLNKNFAEGYELVNANMVADNNLFAIFKKRNSN